MDEVKVLSNKCYYYKGSTVYIASFGYIEIVFNGCNFSNNTSVRGAAVYIDLQVGENLVIESSSATIQHSVFDHNLADESVIYFDSNTGRLSEMRITINASDFINNVGVCMLLSQCALILVGNVLFKSNTADNGGALYIDEASTVYISDGANISFIDNYAILHGGAIC